MQLQNHRHYYNHHRMSTEPGDSMKENWLKKTEQHIEQQTSHYEHHERLAKVQSRSAFSFVAS